MQENGYIRILTYSIIKCQGPLTSQDRHLYSNIIKGNINARAHHLTLFSNKILFPDIHKIPAIVTINLRASVPLPNPHGIPGPRRIHRSIPTTPSLILLTIVIMPFGEDPRSCKNGNLLRLSLPFSSFPKKFHGIHFLRFQGIPAYLCHHYHRLQEIDKVP